MRTLIIHNPASGPQVEDIFSFARSALRPDDELVMRATSSADDVVQLARDAADFDAVVASGGDGTVARVAYAIRDLHLPLLVFPSGTANLLANNIGNASEPAALASTLHEGRTARFDMGEISYRDKDGNEHAQGFLTMAGAGFDADIMRGSQGLKPMFGQLSYYLAAFGSTRSPCSHMRLTLDGTPLEADGICVLAGVWGVINPGIELIPGSSPRDGLIDLVIVKAARPTQLVPVMMGAMLGQGLDEASVEVHRVREAVIECDPALPMQFDGEPIDDATTPVTVRVIPGGLTTFVDDISPFGGQSKLKR